MHTAFLELAVCLKKNRQKRVWSIVATVALSFLLLGNQSYTGGLASCVFEAVLFLQVFKCPNVWLRRYVSTICATPKKDFEPYKGKIRKSGTGCVTMINDHLYEGRFTPTNADGKRISRNIYAQTREECEEKLAELIKTMKAEIAEEKAKLKEGAE